LHAAQLALQGKHMDLQAKAQDQQMATRIQQSEARDTQIRAAVDLAKIQASARTEDMRSQEIAGKVALDKTGAILNLANAAKVGHDAAVDRHDATLAALETIVDSIVKMNPSEPVGVSNA
jgi:hypothetical protein